MLYLSGVNVNPFVASKRRKAGEIERLVDGVFCDFEDLEDLPGFVRKHAVRIANYIYPEAALTYASAVMRGAIPTSDNRKHSKLFVAGKYKHTHTGIPYLSIVQSDELKSLTRIGGLYEHAVINDTEGLADEERGRFLEELGELRVLCATDELVFLQMFGRRRYNLERFLTDEQFRQLTRKLLIRQPRERLREWMLHIADVTTSYGTELQRALAAIVAAPDPRKDTEMRKPLYDFRVAWNGRAIGRLLNDGMGWHFDYTEGWLLPLSFQKRLPGTVPAFISNLFPEGWMLDVMRASSTDDALILSRSERYLANISIVDRPQRITELPEDVMAGRLAQFTTDDDGVFTGEVSGLPPVDHAFIQNLGLLVQRKEMPRISGTQMKIPMHLARDGKLYPAIDSAFTHIFKLGGYNNDRYNAKAAVEWTSMRMIRSGGIQTCKFALVEMPGMEPAYVAERFDVRTGDEDLRLIFSEDLCSVRGVGVGAKFTGAMESIGMSIKEHSDSPTEDMEQVLRMTVGAWIIENGDFHLKNLSLVKVAAPTLERFRGTRLSPCYDMMCTQPFASRVGPPEEVESLALSVNGKKVDFEIGDFVAFGAALGIPREDGAKVVRDTIFGIAREAAVLKRSLPAAITKHPEVARIAGEVCERAIRQACRMVPELQDELSNKQGPKSRVKLAMA